jgi:glycosyltransferase involved in cell wall biosynthesis
MARLRIGINALYLIPGGVGGTEIYLRHLLPALGKAAPQDEFVVFTNRESGPDLAPRLPNFRVVAQPVRASLRPLRILWEQTGLPLAAALHGVDVLLNPGFTAPVACACPSVTVFHDLQHKRHPEYFRWFDLPFWHVCLWASARRSRILLADSEATRRDLLHYYRLPAGKVRTVPLGVDPVFFELGRRRLETAPDCYFLCVSTLHPHKNIERLVRAYAEVRRRRPEFRLVVAGLRGFHAEAIESLVGRLGLEHSVRLTGWIPREELCELYTRAFAVAYPSTFEGFGLPVLEALAAGIPTACSSIEPLASVAGEAALQFDPLDETAIAAALERLAGDFVLRDRLAAAGPARATLFPWENTARATLDALREAAGY